MQDKIITSSQLRAARSVLGWSVAHIADETGIGTATLKRYEASSGVPKSRKGHLDTLRKMYEAAGIEFIGTPDDGPGIRIHRSGN
jgi:transcriptional regulator with XRE-family HTH domain